MENKQDIKKEKKTLKGTLLDMGVPIFWITIICLGLVLIQIIMGLLITFVITKELCVHFTY